MNNFEIVNLLISGMVFIETKLILNVLEALDIFFKFDTEELKDNPQYAIRKRFEENAGIDRLDELQRNPNNKVFTSA